MGDDTLARMLGIDPDSPSAKRARALVDADHTLIRALRNRREELGMTVEDVAAAIGQDPQYVRERESFFQGDPHLSFVRRYAHAVQARITHTVSFDD